MKRIVRISFIAVFFALVFAMSGCYTSLHIQEREHAVISTDSVSYDVSVVVFPRYRDYHFYPGYSDFYFYPYWRHYGSYYSPWNYPWYRFGLYWNGYTIGWWNDRYIRPWYIHPNVKYRPPPRTRDTMGGRGFIRKEGSLMRDNDAEKERQKRIMPRTNSGKERTREGVSPRKERVPDKGKSPEKTPTKRGSVRERGRR